MPLVRRRVIGTAVLSLPHVLHAKRGTVAELSPGIYMQRYGVIVFAWLREMSPSPNLSWLHNFLPCSLIVMRRHSVM